MQSTSQQVDNTLGSRSMLEWQQLNSSTALSAAQSHGRDGDFPETPSGFLLHVSLRPHADRNAALACWGDHACLASHCRNFYLTYRFLSVDEMRKCCPPGVFGSLSISSCTGI